MARKTIDDDDDDDDDEAEDEEERPRRSGRRSRPSIDRGGDEKPGKVQGIGIMSLIGGIFSILVGVGLAAGFTIAGLGAGLGGLAGGCPCGFCGCLGLFWPGIYYSLVVGILAIIKGCLLLGSSAQQNYPPIYIGVMLIINIINADMVSLVLGILILVFCADEEVKGYLRG